MRHTNPTASQKMCVLFIPFQKLNDDILHFAAQFLMIKGMDKQPLKRVCTKILLQNFKNYHDTKVKIFSLSHFVEFNVYSRVISGDVHTSFNYIPLIYYLGDFFQIKSLSIKYTEKTF